MIKKLASHLGEYRRAALLTPMFSALEAVMDILLPTIMAFIIDLGIEKGDMNAIVKYGLLTFAVAAIALLLGVLAGKYAAEASTGFAGNLRDAMYENIQHYSFSNIDKFSTAGLVTRMTTDVTNLQNAFQMMERMCVRAPVHLVFALIMAFSIGGPLALIFVVAVAFLLAVLASIMVPTFKIFDRVFKNYDNLNASVQENVSAIRVVKSFVREGFENEKYTKACEGLYQQFVNAESRLSFNNPAMLTAIYGCNIALSWFGAKYILHGALTTGQLNALFGYIMNILMALMMLSMAFVMISMSAASAKRFPHSAPPCSAGLRFFRFCPSNIHGLYHNFLFLHTEIFILCGSAPSDEREALPRKEMYIFEGKYRFYRSGVQPPATYFPVSDSPVPGSPAQ